MMSDRSCKMNFENLPNEIHILCFGYLTIFEIYQSFTQLNARFTNLIENLQFQLNFSNISKVNFDQFCQYLQTNSHIRNQIYSLILSNHKTYGQIQLFLSFFSFEQFPNLRQLKLIEIRPENLHPLKPLLPYLTNLYSFAFISPYLEIKDIDILYTLPLSNLQILSIPTLDFIQIDLDQRLNLTYLTIDFCSLEGLYYCIFKYFPLLKYLNIHSVTPYHYSIENIIDFHKSNGFHLKQLILHSFQYDFQSFVNFIQQIPHLESLTINMHNDFDTIDGNQWKDLIKRSLLYLKSLQFYLSCTRKNHDDRVLEFFQQFQDEFWCKQHRWFTEYSLGKSFAAIYTIPYISDHYRLDLNTSRYSNKSINTFKNVTSLTMKYDHLPAQACQFDFSNVNSLILIPSNLNRSMNIDYIKTIINLTNLTSLNLLQDKQFLTQSLVFQIIKQSPKLTELSIDSSYLLTLCINNNDLCEYLNKQIKTLFILNFNINSLDNMEKFCRIFSNIEQLTCDVNQLEEILFLIENLSKLSSLNVHLPTLDNENLLKQTSFKSNFIYSINQIGVNRIQLLIWIGRYIH